jgi:mono/diheme cytochrome c family protein
VERSPATSTGRLRRVAAVLVLATAALGAVGCSGTVGYDQGTGDRTRGKELFVQRCGSCHVLADAGTRGEIGPNLDFAFYQYRVDATGADPEDADFQSQLADADIENTVRQVVRGQIAYPVTNPSTDAQGMPADLVTGDDAAAVASYVASVAGLGGDKGPPAPPSGDGGGGGGGGGEPDGKQIFTSAGCAGCHVLADAGSDGTVGPNLDDAKPTRELAVDRVTNGRGAMPSFEGQLSDAEIDAVAQYVSSVAGK